MINDLSTLIFSHNDPLSLWKNFSGFHLDLQLKYVAFGIKVDCASHLWTPPG